MFLADFNSCKDSHDYFLGNAGAKLGVWIDGERWILKFPKTTKGMLVKAGGPSYTTSPLSEYVGSQIYGILGYDVHKTMLGVKDDKVVVACKNFAVDGWKLEEFRSIKNYYNKELEKMLELTITPSDDNGHFTSLNAVKTHLEFNSAICDLKGASERFWDCIVIDGFINNNDRNTGNWGYLKNEDTGEFKLAPIYDNGASFYNKVSEVQFEKRLGAPDIIQNCTNVVTAFEYDGKDLNYRNMLNLDIDGLKDAIRRVVPIIESNMKSILNMIDSIPEKEGKYEIIGKFQKEYYKKSLEIRLENLLIPKFKELSLEHENTEVGEKETKNSISERKRLPTINDIKARVKEKKNAERHHGSQGLKRHKEKSRGMDR